MDLQKKLIELSEYNCGCRFMDGFFLINITYPHNWSVISPENELIEHGEKNGVYYYAAPMSEVEIDEAFEVIDDIITYNKDVEMKMQLLKDKIMELQEIFAQEDYKTLQNLTFKYKKSGGSKKTKAVEQSVEQKPVEKTDDGVVDLTGDDGVVENTLERPVSNANPMQEQPVDDFQSDDINDEESLLVDDDNNKQIEIVDR